MLRDVTIANLEMACWIARLGSFTAAAERLNTTQPAISARVRDLEDALGMKLFDRHTRGVQLTIEGREFLHNSEPLLRQLEELAFSANKSSAGGKVHLGASSICMEIVARLSRYASTNFPNVYFHVETDRAANLLEGVEARRHDVAIVSGPVDPLKFSARSLGMDKVVWVIAAELHDRFSSCDLAALFAAVPIWCVSQDSFYWAIGSEALNARGIQPKRVNELSNNTVALAKVIALGGGIGLMSQSAVTTELAGGQLIPVPGLPSCSEIEFSIVCRKDRETSGILSEIMDAAVRESTLRQPPGQASGT